MDERPVTVCRAQNQIKPSKQIIWYSNSNQIYFKTSHQINFKPNQTNLNSNESNQINFKTSHQIKFKPKIKPISIQMNQIKCIQIQIDLKFKTNHQIQTKSNYQINLKFIPHHQIKPIKNQNNSEYNIFPKRNRIKNRNRALKVVVSTIWLNLFVLCLPLSCSLLAKPR